MPLLPHRAVILTAKIEADTRADMVEQLLEIINQIERQELRSGVSGSVHSGYILDYVENGEPSNEMYYEQLRAYLADRTAAIAK
jgi:hypothetical protein